MADGACAPEYRVPWSIYLWLIYLLYIPVVLIESHAGPVDWLIDLSGIAVFLSLYRLGFRLDGWPALFNIAAIFALAVVYTPRNPGAIAYAIYAAAFIGWSFEHRSTAYGILAGYTALVALAAWLEHLHEWSLVPELIFVVLVGTLNIQYSEERRAARRLRLAYDEVERLAKVAERERIARDLHDVLGHTLSLIVLKSELASKLVERDLAGAAVEIRDVERIARGSLAELRAAVAGYRSAGIAAEIEHAREVFATAGVELQCDAAELHVPPQYEGVLSLAIREAVTNVVRHAHARAVHLRLTSDGGVLRLEVRDDGRGTNAPEGAGLRGMRERVEALGGMLERVAGDGTQLVVTLPRTAGASS